MRKYLFLPALLLVLAGFSCKKNKTSATAPNVDSQQVYPNYTMMKPGNYWIYEVYRLDSATTDSGMVVGEPDSSYCGNDTVINGKTYHQFYEHSGLGGDTNAYYTVTLLRDSLSYEVTPGGGIVFSSEDFTDTFRAFKFASPIEGIPDSVLITYLMGFKNASITVPAGTFVTSTYREVWNFSPPNYSFGAKEYDHKYAAGVGLVLETTGFYTASPLVYERLLLRYHVQ